jgi:cation:H+ antiporter
MDRHVLVQPLKLTAFLYRGYDRRTMNAVHALHEIIRGDVLIAWIALAAAFIILAKSADLFVDSAVGIADKLKVPKLIIGVFLVSLATTAPELSVSLNSAIRGNPEMALGNAIGSVIVDDTIALGLAGLVATGPILIIPHVLRTAGLFLVGVQVLSFVFVLSTGSLRRWEGAVLVALFLVYTTYIYFQHKRGKFAGDLDLEAIERAKDLSLLKTAGLFVLGVVLIVFSGGLVVTSATTLARSFGIPESVIALTLVAFGTSIPEIATCVAAARKGQGALAVGNILGADILNICWIAGASAIANDLVLDSREIYFMFPAMFVVVGTMLLMLFKGYRLTRAKGAVLFALYLVFAASFFFVYQSP